MITEKYVMEFQIAYKTHTGVDLSYEEAYEQGMRLLRMIRAVYNLSEPEHEELESRRNIETKS
jgi:hypothetical protein